MQSEQLEIEDQRMLPYGFVDDGSDDTEYVDDDGQQWEVVDRWIT